MIACRYSLRAAAVISALAICAYAASCSGRPHKVAPETNPDAAAAASNPREGLAQWVESEGSNGVRAGRMVQAGNALMLLRFLQKEERAAALENKIRASYAHRAAAMKMLAGDAESAGDARAATLTHEKAGRAEKYLEER